MGSYDAIVLAAAGLARLQLDLQGLEIRFLSPELFVPAPAQGVLALECRRDDFELASVLTELHSVEAYKVVAAERGLMAMLQGGCQLALGAHGVLKRRRNRTHRLVRRRARHRPTLVVRRYGVSRLRSVGTTRAQSDLLEG